LSPRAGWPVSKKPEDKTKDDFVRLVWRELTPDAFKNIGEFQEWFNKTLAPRTIESLGGAQVGGMLLRVTFPHGGMQHFNHGGLAHFMQWVMMKFTTTTKPQLGVNCTNYPDQDDEADDVDLRALEDRCRLFLFAREPAEPAVEPAVKPESNEMNDTSPCSSIAFVGDHGVGKSLKGAAVKSLFCTNHSDQDDDQDDVEKRALEDRCLFLFAKEPAEPAVELAVKPAVEPAVESAAAQSAPKPTGLAAMMDDKNRAMLEVMKKEGPEAAAKAMMKAADYDYAEMRMMYG